jgi:23S rRNA pseudouridine1911/1915/1917 synthase
LDVVYEDEHLMVINKPAGLVVHPAPGHAADTMVNALLAYRPAVTAADADPARPGIVHRLDRDTSGLLVVAATRAAQDALQATFKSRRVAKIYLALVFGTVELERAAIEAPLGRDPRQRQRMAVLTEGGRAARTNYAVRERLPGATLLEAGLITGRTHQIRVHLASIGHPVVGDRVYGPRRQAIVAPRQMLHAWRLELAHPITGAPLAFEAPLPADMAAVLEGLRTGRP